MVRIIDRLPDKDREFIVSLDILVDDGIRGSNEDAYINATVSGKLDGMRRTWVVFMNGYFAGQSRYEVALNRHADRQYGASNYLIHRVNGVVRDPIDGPKIL